jgi:transcriptional regulator GlxA family with amidase domain
VCTGALLLGAAGALDGRRATTHWSCVQLLADYGATPVGDERVVEDGKVITAAGVSAGIDMGLLLASRLAGEDVARAAQLLMEYAPEPPFDGGTPATTPPSALEKLPSMLVAREVEFAQEQAQA